MKTSPLISSPRLLARGHHYGSLALWIAGLVALEVHGRRTTTDFADAAALLMVLVAVVLTLHWHRSRTLPWVAALTARIRALLARVEPWRIDVGADFRGAPPVPTGLPPVLWFPVALLSALVAVALPLHPWLPTGLRAAVIRASYDVWLLLLGGIWSAGIAAAVHLFFQVHGQVHAAFAARALGGALHRRVETAAHLVLLLLLAMCWTSLPVSLALGWAALVIVGVLAALLLPRRPRLPLLWRAGRSPEIRAIDVKPLLALQFLGLALALLLLVLLTRGAWLHRSADLSAMPLTALLGVVLAWLTAAGVTVMAWRVARILVLERRHDPARPVTPAVHVAGDLAPDAREDLRQRLAARGLALRDGPRRPLDVPLRIGTPDAEPDPFAPAWPRTVPLAEVDAEDQVWRYRRRFDVLCRRRLLRGVKALFRIARRRRYRRGEGFWLAPQYWFVTGMTRDSQEGDDDADPVIGPPYHRLFERPVRHRFGAVCRDLEVDVLFVEDGVRFPALRLVLETLFELHDRHGAAERAEERHFTGIPRVRVIVQEFTLVTPPRDDHYPEPDHEDIGRARILNVFRDRGGDPVRPEAPADLSWIPAGTF